jgi:CheY-like chemotaxis protein
MARILVIDDDATVRLATCKTLQMDGHEVQQAENGLAGIESYRESPSDLVITDIVMPGMHGLDVIKTLKAEYPDIRIVALSDSGVEDLKKSTTIGAKCAIEKPFLTRELLRAVNGSLAEDD